MIHEFTNNRGHRAFTLTAADLSAATEWARSMCHLVYGVTEGEERFRDLPARQVLSMWAQQTTTPIEA
jgi:hypothetical protein